MNPLSAIGNWWDRLSKTAHGILLGSVVLIAIGLAVLNNDRNKQQQNETKPPEKQTENAKASTPTIQLPAPSAEETMIKNLAIIEGAQNDAAKVSRIRSILAELDKRYPEDSLKIGDMTAAAYGQLEKMKKPASITGIMEAMMKASEAKVKVTYSDAVTAYLLLRQGGMN